MHLIIRFKLAIEQTFRVIKHKYSDYRMKEEKKKLNKYLRLLCIKRWSLKLSVIMDAMLFSRSDH